MEKEKYSKEFGLDIAFVIKEAQVLGFRSQCSTMTLVQTLAIVLGLEKEKDKNTK